MAGFAFYHSLLLVKVTSKRNGEGGEEGLHRIA